ncbi:MAG: hypothetical protein FD131_3360 [Rhodocyclaceae bacterium]|nr:MAG: hypothetical protein FD131_3360 [Rhodocyclaceae bacterium]
MKINTPFTPAQVQVLNERQVHVDGSIPIHPSTCPNRGDGITYDAAGNADDTVAIHGTEGGDRGVLIATEIGWVCPHCDYRQDWAHAAMAERPVPVGEMFKDFPTIAEIYGAVRPEELNPLIVNYRAQAAQGRPGAEVMWFCLELRRMTLAGNMSHRVEEVER